MPSGGKREGAGRPGGSLNKKTVLKQEATAAAVAALTGVPAAAAQGVIDAAQQQGGPPKHGKDILDAFANIYAGLAARYQPWPLAKGVNPNEDEERFKIYSKLAVDAANKGGDFFDARLRRIDAPVAPPGIRNVVQIFTLEIFEGERPALFDKAR